MKNQTKKNAVIKYIIDKIQHQPLSYQVYKKLWDKLNTANTGSLNKEILKSILIYICSRYISGNRDAMFSGDRFEDESIPSNVLRTIFGNSYTTYISFLEQQKLLEIIPYKVGSHSNKFSIPYPYRGVTIHRSISHDLTEKRVRKYNLNKFNKHKELFLRSFNALYWYTTDKLEIPNAFKEAAISLSLQVPMYSSDLVKNTKTKNVTKAMYYVILGHISEWTNHMNNMQNHFYNVLINYRGWRLYSSLTNMPSILRNFLLYDKQYLCAYDIKNSQAMHLCHLFHPTFWSVQPVAYSFKTFYLSSELQEGNTLYDYFQTDPTLLKEFRTLINEKPKDLLLFESLCSQGTFYEYLSIQLKAKYPSHHTNRDASKGRWLKFLNCKLENTTTSAYGDYRKFKEMFPNVCGFIEAMKSRSYKDISTLLNRIEAKMLVQEFTAEFSNKYPQVPVFTVHDSFITLSIYKTQALAVFDSVYNKFGLKPKTSNVEELHFPNAMVSMQSYITKKL